MEALNIDWGSHKNEKEDDIGVSVKEDTKEMQELNVFGEAKSIESVERKTKEETEEEFLPQDLDQKLEKPLTHFQPGFEGSCPIGFLDNSYMPRGVKIHARKEFLDSFAGGE